MNLYIENIPYTTSEADLRRIFEPCGGIVRISIPIERETQRPRGFAFVEMTSVREGQRAIRDLDGAKLGGREIRVTTAKPSKKDDQRRGQ